MLLDATSNFENILVVNDVLIPQAVELNALLCTYGEPAHDENLIAIESNTDCTTNVLDSTSGEPEACHIASSTPEPYQCAHSDHLSKTMVYTDGETSLHALAIELDSLLYSKIGRAHV